MFEFLKDKLNDIIGHEAERQNAIARFGTGIPIDKDGMVADPRDTTKKIHVDDFGKLPVADRMKSIAPAVARLATVKQILPGDINENTAAEIVASSLVSGDDIGRHMRGDQSAAPSEIAAKAKSINDGPMMSLLRGSVGEAAPEAKSKMRLG